MEKIFSKEALLSISNLKDRYRHKEENEWFQTVLTGNFDFPFGIDNGNLVRSGLEMQSLLQDKNLNYEVPNLNLNVRLIKDLYSK